MMRFLRRHFVRIVIGAVLVVAAFFAISVYSTYNREKRIAREIEALGGTIVVNDILPNVIPQLIKSRLPLFDRVRQISLTFIAIPVDLLVDIPSLSHVETLDLYRTHFNDSQLQHLSGLRTLKNLNLSYTQITDTGLQQLSGMSHLEWLSIYGTDVTVEAREQLRMALPNCKIVPNP